MLTRELARCQRVERAWLKEELETCARHSASWEVRRACDDTVARDLHARRRLCPRPR